ncbi:MAG TPA: MBL fold metallo-hydrolase [Stellaceae bacterium]
MDTRIDEIGDGIYRMATFAATVGGPQGFTFCEFVIGGDEPMLFHCGHRQRFASGAAALARVMPVERLRWVGYSHAEADEAGALNEWLGAAPHATAVQGRIGCNIWLNDTAIRPPRALKDGETIDLGGKTMRYIATPHLPHCWDAGLMFEETTGTLFCSDLFAQPGEVPLFSEGDIVDSGTAFEAASGSTSITPTTATLVRKLAALKPRKLALMHGPVYTGDAVAALNALADYYEGQLKAAVEG